MNDLTSQISACARKGLHLSDVIHAEGVVWRGGELTDAQHVRAALAAMCSGSLDKRFLEATAADVISLAMGHVFSARHNPIGDLVLDEAVWQFALGRQYVYTEMVETITGRYLTPA